MLDFMDSMYRVRDDEVAIFGEFWCGPAWFSRVEDALVAKIPKSPADGYGYNVEVYCGALPSRFYKVRVLPTPNSVNEMRPGFTLSTGSGMAAFALQFAKHAAEGMLGMAADGVGTCEKLLGDGLCTRPKNHDGDCGPWQPVPPSEESELPSAEVARTIASGVKACGFFDCPGCDACKHVTGGVGE